MAEDKEITKRTYVWAHVGTIMFHVLIGALLIALYFKDSLGAASRKTMVLILGVILVVISLLALIPILQNYNKIIIS